MALFILVDPLCLWIHVGNTFVELFGVLFRSFKQFEHEADPKDRSQCHIESNTPSPGSWLLMCDFSKSCSA